MLGPSLTLGENAQGVNTAVALERRLPALWVPEGALSGCLGGAWTAGLSRAGG